MKRYLRLFLIFIAVNIVTISAIVISHDIQQKKYSAMVDEKERESYLSIIVTDKMVYNMVTDITGDMADVSYMFKNENDVLNYKFTEDAVQNLGRQDIFIYLGMENEPWVDGLVSQVKRERVSIVNASRGIITNQLSKPRIINEKEYKINPYYWLNNDNYKTALNNIKASIIEKDSKNKSIYEENFKKAVKEADDKNEEFLKAIDNLKEYTFVTAEDSFDYLLSIKSLKHTKISPLSKNTNGTIVDNPNNQSVENKDANLQNKAEVGGNEKTIDTYKEEFKDNNKIIFLYSSNEIKDSVIEIINECKMKPVYIDINRESQRYTDIIQQFIEVFNNIQLSSEDK